jgi:hypothetical protein
MLKEALAKRNDELQAARLMCAKTASRLTAVEDELEMLRAGTLQAQSIPFGKSELTLRKIVSNFNEVTWGFCEQRLQSWQT